MAAQGGLEPAANATEYSRAFLTGWRLAQLYASPAHTAEIQADVKEEGYLPDIPQSLTQEQQVRLIWTSLASDLSGLPGGDSQSITDAKTRVRTSLDGSGFDEQTITADIENVYKKTLTDVYVINPQIANAIILGKQLASMVFRPINAPDDPAALLQQLSAGRVQRTCALLEELQSSFSLRATAAVSGSLVYWQRSVQTHTGHDYAVVRENLRKQGELWRSLLSGEKHADDLLALHDYQRAFGDYLRKLRDLVKKNGWLWGMVLTLFAAAGAGIGAIVTWAPKGAAVVAGVIAAGAGALGITWKTIASTAGRVTVLLERPLFDDGLSEAVKFAAFIPPATMDAAQIAKLRKEVGKGEQQIEGKPRASKRLKWLWLPGRAQPAVEAVQDRQALPPGSEEAEMTGSEEPKMTEPLAEEDVAAGNKA